MNKQNLRKLYLEKRKSIPLSEKLCLDENIIKNFLELHLKGTEVIHLFYPIQEKNEFNTLRLKTYLSSQYPALKFVLPKIQEDGGLDHFLWDENTPLFKNKWGIIEPESGTIVSSNEIDIVIIPLLTCDINGNRVGYGKGFYDRLLAKCRNDALKTGISYFDPILEVTDINQFDVPLNICITPSKIWNFSGIML